MTTVEFDAQGKVLGRLATQIAVALMGKTTPDFRRDRLSDVKVVVHHADQVVVTGTKSTTKFYYKFSGYPGGLSKKSFTQVKAEHPDRMLKLAVKRMLPKNKLQAKLMKRLTLEVSST
ncbi:MAG: 50S ribosomal protein L13 [Candidatus Kerfeldbacteria bacterium]|nr:50S ribosomal protein L13 [Candidatus Kerfeldbacteria bacterium]